MNGFIAFIFILHHLVLSILIMHIVAYFIVVFSSIVLVLIQVSEDRLLHLEHLLLMINAR
jgi:hypothetical protein